MKKLLLISSVLVVMMCNVVFAGSNFSFAKIEWTDTPEQMKQKIVDSKALGECIESNGPFRETYVNIFTSIDFIFENSMEDEKIIEDLDKEQIPFIFCMYRTAVQSNEYKFRVKNYRTEEPNILRVFYSEDRKEVLGYGIVFNFAANDRNNLKVLKTSRVEKHGKPDKILHEGSEYSETYKWEDGGELLYVNNTPYNTSVLLVNMNTLKKHIKRIKKKAKKEGIIK